MIHPKIPSPSHISQRKKRLTSSGKTLIGSAKTVLQDERAISTEPEDPIPVRYSDVYKREKIQAEMGNMLKKKKGYPIAPDALIPNSTSRTIFKKKVIKSVESKIFKLRLDILANLQDKDKNWQDDDDEWAELGDPDDSSQTTGAKKSKGTLMSRQKFNSDLFSEDSLHNIYWTKETMPDLFKRIQNEPWWTQPKEEKPNLHSMLHYLINILKLRATDSYGSACDYVVEIFRTYGIEPTFVEQILDVLLEHLKKEENDLLNICTIRTIAQFMIERKYIIIRLLDHALQYQPTDTCRLEVVNAVKFITDVTDMDLVFDNMPIVRDSPEDSFSLKMIIRELENSKKTVTLEAVNEGEESENLHPLLKKISEERWFPRENFPITLDSILNAIITKVPNTTKTMLKTLTVHLVQLDRVIGYSYEQFDRVSNSLISLLSHTDADYRLIAATNLANFNKETKTIDIALLTSFLNDSRILVRTECCDSLKKLTGIMSDTVLTDCADAIPFLQTLSEENFSLQNYLTEKNRLPTPPPPPPSPPIVGQASLLIEEKVDEEEVIPINEDEQSLITNQTEKTSIIRSPSPPPPQIVEQPSITHTIPPPLINPSHQVSVTSSLTSFTTPVPTQIRVEIIEKSNPITPHASKSRQERTLIHTNHQRKQPISPIKTPVPDQIFEKRPSLLPNNTNMWNSYAKQQETDESRITFDPELQSTVINDPIQTIIDEHKQNVGFYRMIPTRPILIPHKITMENIFGDQSHIMIDRHIPQMPSFQTNTMNLSDLNRNQRHLIEVEFVQLLSSLIIRSIQVHRQHEKFLPGAYSTNFTNVLNISQMQVHSSVNSNQSNTNNSQKLPPIAHQQPTSRLVARIRAEAQNRAAKAGINLHKAQHMENALSNLLKSNRDQTKSTTSHPPTSKKTNVTHAWLLVQLLKSQGTFESESYLQQIIRAYPKFLPLLHTRVPQNLISIISNDPIMKQLASIFAPKQNDSTIESSSIKPNETKQSVSVMDDDYSLNGFDYSTLIHRDDHRKKFLPTLHGSKVHLPRHVLKFGFREIDKKSPESSDNSLRDDSRSRSRKRRVYMHLMMAANENMHNRHESVKNRLRQMIKTDYGVTSFVPIVARPPMCH